MENLRKYQEKQRFIGYQNEKSSYTERRYSLKSMKYYSNIRNEIIHKIITENYSENGKVDIIDIGCGTGVVLEGLVDKNPNYKLRGLDFTKKMLIEAKGRLRAKTNEIEFIQGSAFELPLESNFVDVAIGTRFIHQYTNNLKITLLGEMMRIIKPNGLLIVEFYSYFTWFIRRLFIKNSESRNIYFAHCTKKQDLQLLLKNEYYIEPIMLPFGSIIVKCFGLSFLKYLNKLFKKMNIQILFDQYFVIIKKNG